MADYWDEPLATPIKLKGRLKGVTLTTLRDAGRFVSEHFRTVTHHAALDAAISDLMQAAETGDAGDIVEATNQLWRVLKFNELV